ncbi:MAG: flavodoxin domain-containing protein [Methanosarcina sp.]
MQTKVLVAYATRYGSTQEVAQAIADTLRECGLEVDLEPMRKIKTLEGYTGVVFGAPLYIMHWNKDAHNFLSQHREALADKQVAVFALGALSNDEEECKEVRAQLDKELAKYQWLKPVAVETFGGKYDSAKLHFLDKIIVSMPANPLHKVQTIDVRDWTAIQAWAKSLAIRFKSASPE